MTGGGVIRRAARTAADAAMLLALSAALAAGCNALRMARRSPAALPWIGDWDSYVETKAFEAGIGIAGMSDLQSESSAAAPAALLDARPRDLYRAGHIPRALPCPAGDVEAALAELVATLDPAAPLAVYCDGAACEDSLEVALDLKARGFAQVAIYPGGWTEWTANGGPVETTPEAAP